LWQKEGLEVPDAIQEATADYQSESDHLGSFLDESYESCPDGFVEVATLRQDYEAWAKLNGEKMLDVTSFAGRLRSRGYSQKRVGHKRTRDGGAETKTMPFLIFLKLRT